MNLATVMDRLQRDGVPATIHMVQHAARTGKLGPIPIKGVNREFSEDHYRRLVAYLSHPRKIGKLSRADRQQLAAAGG